MLERLRRLIKKMSTPHRRPGVIELSRETAREAVYATVMAIARNPLGMTDPRRATCLAKAHDLLEHTIEQEKAPAPEIIDRAALARTAHLLYLARDLCNEAAKLDEPLRSTRINAPDERVEVA